MGRIKLEDDVRTAIIKLGGGNPGGLTVCMNIIKYIVENPSLGLNEGFLLLLDDFEIYESDIWVLFKDICGQDIGQTINVISATQQSILSKEELRLAIVNGRESRKCGLDLNYINDQLAKLTKEDLDIPA